MIKINKITTKTGDEGLTLGVNFKKTSKSSDEIEFFGKLDEVNCYIGLVLTQKDKDFDTNLLSTIQHQLFEIGSFYYKQTIPDFSSWIKKIEKEIEKQNNNETITSFIIPNGDILSIYLNIARVQTRSAERVFWKIYNPNVENLNLIGVYLNRLSDYIFVFIKNSKNKKFWIHQNI